MERIVFAKWIKMGLKHVSRVDFKSVIVWAYCDTEVTHIHTKYMRLAAFSSFKSPQACSRIDVQKARPDLELGLGSVLLDLHGSGILAQ